MALTIQNLVPLTQSSLKLGEALQSVQTYINKAVATPAGNKVPVPPSKFFNPAKL